MPMLVLENISKTFRDAKRKEIPALRNLSLSVHHGELLVVVGPSGCGKTTMLRLIAGLEETDQGRIILDGQTLNRIPPQNRDIAMVFQTAALLPHLNVFDNLALGLKLRKTPRVEIEKRVSDAASVLGLSEKLDRKPEQLSGGEAQRVSLGRALVRQPKVFLLDEPLSNLDPITRKQLRREIVCLHQRLKVPMIHVTHDQHEALSLGQRIAVMKDGVLQQLGTPDEIRKKPANEFVTEFFEPA